MSLQPTSNSLQKKTSSAVCLLKKLAAPPSSSWAAWSRPKSYTATPAACHSLTVFCRISATPSALCAVTSASPHSLFSSSGSASVQARPSSASSTHFSSVRFRSAIPQASFGSPTVLVHLASPAKPCRSATFSICANKINPSRTWPPISPSTASAITNSPVSAANPSGSPVFPSRKTSFPSSASSRGSAASSPPMSASGTALTSSSSATAYGSAASLQILISSVNLSRSTISLLPSSAFFPLPLTLLQFSHREATSIFSIRFLSRRKRIAGATHSPWLDASNPAHQPKARKSNSPSSPSASLTIILSAMI